MRTTLRLTLVLTTLLVALFGLSSGASAQPTITACPAVSTGGIAGIGVVDALPLTATGGTGPVYSWTLAAGTLPPGLSIRSDVPAFITDPTATAFLAGVATSAGGPYNFTLRVTNNGLSSDLSCSLMISSLVFKSPQGLPSAFVNQPFSYTLTALRNGNQVFPTWAVNPLTPLPNGISLNTATGELWGTPGATASGFYTIGIEATENGEKLVRSITLQVFDVTIATPAQLPNATQGQPYQLTLSASGGTAPYVYAVSGLPNGLALDPSGVILGTTTARGPFTFTVTVTDQAGRSFAKLMSLVVIGSPKMLPSIAPGSGAFDDCTIGAPCSRQVVVFGGGTGPFTWSATGLPPGMSIRSGSASDASPGVPPKDAELWGTIVAPAGTVYNITITATDFDGATATNTFPLRVSDLAMAIVSGTNWTVGVPGQQRLRIIGGSSLPAVLGVAPDGTNYSASIINGAAPLGIGLGAGSGCLSAVDFCGIPGENISTTTRLRFVQGSSQLDRSYSFNVSGGGSSTIQINTPGSLGTFPTGMTYTRVLSACCTSNPLSWTIVSGALPSGFTLSTSGVLSGATVAGAVGSYTFVVKAADSVNASNFGLRQFTLGIVANAMTTGITLPTGKVGTPYSITLSTLAGGGTWSLNAYNYLPPNFTLNSATGLLSGTPTASGQFSFALTNSVGPVSAVFTLQIYPASYNPPTFNLGNQVAAFGPFTLQLTASGGSGSGYVFSLSPGAEAVPGLRIQNGAPLPTSFPGTTTAGLVGVLTQPGVWPTSIRVTDSAQNFFDRPITVTVSPITILSQPTLPKGKWGQSYQYQLEAYGGVGYTWALTNGSSGSYCGLTISASGQISGTPDKTFAPCSAATTVLSPIIRVTAGSYSTSLTFSITPNPFDLTTAGKLPEGTVGIPYTDVQLAAETNCGGTCTWSVSSGSLPTGFALSPAGLLSNTNLNSNSNPNPDKAPTTVVNNSSFTIQATGTSGTVQKQFSLRVVSASPQVLGITSPSTSLASNYFTLGSSVAQILVASGGVPPYAFSVVSGALPPGLSIPVNSANTGETMGANLAPGFLYINGRPMQTGSYTFTLQVADHGGGAGAVSSTRTFTWVVTELNAQYTRLPPTPANSTIPAGQPFNASNQLLVIGGSATEGPGTYTFANLSPLPYGLALNPSTGVISGTPIEVVNASFPIQATDSVSGATLIYNVTLNVTGGATPIAIGQSSSLGTILLGNTISTNLNISGGTGPYTVTGIGLPSWLTINSGNGLFQGQSGFILAGIALQAGTFNFAVTVSDTGGQQTARNFTVTVAGVSLGVSPTLPDGSVGEFYDYKLTTPNGSFSWAIGPGSSLPPGLVLAQIDGAYHVTGTPAVASTGFSFSLSVTDLLGVVFTANYSMKIGSARILDPQILPVAAIVGSTFSYQFHANCPGPADCVTWSAAGVPGNFNFTSAGLLHSIFTVQSPGTFTINVTATPIGGGVAVTRRFTFFSRWPNPLLLDFALGSTQLLDATVGQPTNLSLNPSGGVPPYSWIVAPQHALPPGMSLVDWTSAGSPLPTTTGPGAVLGINPGVWTLSGMPTTAGLYTFDLILKDSVNAEVRRTFTLRVTPVGILQGTTRAGVINDPYVQQFTAIGGNGAATFTMNPVSGFQEMLPPGVTMSPSGLVSGTPTSTGTYAFAITVSQGGNTYTRRFNINVARAADTVNSARNLMISNVNPGDLPLGVGRRSAQFNLAVSTLTASSGAVSNVNPTSYSWSKALRAGETFPPGMVLIDETSPFWEGSPLLGGQPTQAGTFVFTLRATDRATSGPTVGDFAEHTYTLKVALTQIVSPPTEAFVAPDLPSGRVGVPYSTRIRMAGGTPPYHFIESTFLPLPPGLSLSDDGVLSGTPLTTFSGNLFPIVTDSSGNVGANVLRQPLFLQIAPAGTTPHPLNFQTQALEFLNASVGVPYAFPLDTILRGGTAPFSWTLVSGSLPPGVVLHQGSNDANNVSAYLGGIPQTAGEQFRSTLKATDSATPPQQISIDLGIDVSPMAITPDTLVPGQVGVAYSAQLTPSNGIGPFQFLVYPLLDFPPGLTLDPSGMLSGTPTTPGNFAAAIVVVDSDDSYGATIYRFAIDKPTAANPSEGEAPAVSLPTPIQLTYTQQSGSIAPIPLNVNATTSRFPGGANIPFGASIVGIPGATIAPSGVPTGTQLPGTVNLVLDHAALDALSVQYPQSYQGILAVRTGTPNQANGTANLLDQMHVKLTVLPQPPCAPTVTPSTATFPAAGGSGSFTVNAGQGCAWTATTGSPWIALQSQASGSGSATINFNLGPNPDPPTLGGTIDINYGVSQHVSFAVTQFGSACAFDISPKSISATAAGGTAIVNVTASSAQCDWPASDPGVLLPQPPLLPRGNGTVTVTVPPTGSAQGLSYSVTVAGLPFHVNQGGIGCSVAVNPTSVDVQAAGGTDTVAVTTAAGCQYTTLVGPAWVSVTSGGSGTGPGTLVYTVQSNSATAERSGALTIGGTSFNIRQLPAACSVTVDTNLLGSPYTNDAAASAGLVGVATNGNNCPWAASSGASWARLSQYSGTSSLNLRITLDANNTQQPRSTDLTIAGQTINITQNGKQCTYGLQSSEGSVPSGGGLGTVGVVAPSVCTWNATAATIESPTWLHVLGQGGAGTSNVLFSADSNPSAGPRTGSISVAGTVMVGEPPVATTVTRVYSVTQAPAPCSPSLPVSAPPVDALGAVNLAAAFTSNGCVPPVLSYADWIYGVQVSGNNVLYSVQSNPLALSRSGTIQIGDKAFKVTQVAASCAYRLNSYGSIFGQAGGTLSIVAGVNNITCLVPARGTTQNFISFTSPPLPPNWPTSGELTLDALVAAYNSLTVNVRFGNITLGNQFHTVKQTSW
jgi:hypothetical protein